MKRIVYILFIGLAILSFGSCNKDDDTNFKYVALKVVRAELPESFDLNKTYKIKVTYTNPNGCTYFEGFDVIKDSLTTRRVIPIGTTLTDRNPCEEIAKEVEVSFNFIVLFKDKYLFRFWAGEDENGKDQYLEIEVPVIGTSTNK